MANLKRTISLAINGDLAGIKGALSWTKSQKDQIEKSGVTVPFAGETKKLDDSLGAIRAQVKALTDKAKTVKFDANDKALLATFANINRQLTSLGGRVSEPRISVNGAARALSDIAAVDLALSKLGNKSSSAGGGSKLGGIISGLGGAGSGLFGAVPMAGGNPYVGGGIAAAAAVSAPFIGQAAGGGLVAGLGAALAGIGVYAASKLKPVKASFSSLMKSANADLLKIGAPFAPVMESIFSTARGVLGKMTPVFAGAEKTISGPFKLFANTLLTSFNSPAVSTSINAVARAFGAILKSLAPSLPGMINEIANAITAIANNIARNPGAFGVFIHFLVTTIQYALNVVNALTITANFIESHFVPVIRAIGAGFVGMGIVVIGAVRLLLNAVLSAFGSILHGAADAFGWIPGLGGKLRSASASFDHFKNATIGSLDGTISKMNDLKQALDTLPTKKFISVTERGNGSFTVTQSGNTYGFKAGNNAYSVRAAASGWLVNQGSGPRSDDVLARVSRGELIVPAGMVRSGAVDHLRGAIPGFAKGGVVGGSLASLTRGMLPQFSGRMTSAMETAIKAAVSAAKSYVTSAIPGVGSGVSRWTNVVDQALSMLGMSLGLARQVLYQMQTESGGNQFAINLNDSNAAAGDPSRGLLQTTGGTFSRYHVPGTSYNIYDGLANIAAAVNYARAVYGPSLMSGGMGLGSGHGYAAGTNSARRGWAWVGEGGRPELVHFNGGEKVGPVLGGSGGGGRGGYTINVYASPLAHPRDVGREVVNSIKEFEKGSGKGWRS